MVKKEEIINDRWKIAKVSVSDIIYTSVNANIMSDKVMDRLTKNVGISGLSSTITCYKRGDGKYVVISGNHRLRAAIANNLSYVFVIYADESELSDDEIKAIQLSHNSIHGEDDKGILKSIFDSIQSVDFKDFSFIDYEELSRISVDIPSLTPISETYSVNLILFKDDVNSIKELLGIIEDNIGSNELILMSGNEDENKYIEVMTSIKKKYNIKSVNIAFSKLLELALSKLSDEKNSSNNK